MMPHALRLVRMQLASRLLAQRGNKSHGVADLTISPVVFPSQSHHDARRGSGLAPQRRMRSASPGDGLDMNPCQYSSTARSAMMKSELNTCANIPF